jgi:tetratricopeptide (TPR) repeat protein
MNGVAAGMISAQQAGALAQQALARGTEDQVVARVAALAQHLRNDGRLWQWSALLHRALDDRRAALVAFGHARTLLSQDVRVAHGLAQCRYEAGLPCLDEFDAALALAPFDGGLLLGRAAALFSAGEHDRACDSLAQVLAAEPRWIDGHRELAQIRWLTGARDDAFVPLRRSIAQQPSEPAKWQLLLDLQMQAKQFDDAIDTATQARSELGDLPFVRTADIVARAEAGILPPDTHAFAVPDLTRDPAVAVYHVRHLLRHGRPDAAARVIEPWLAGPAAPNFYPYAALIWRLNDDPRFAWLEGDRALVQQYDLSPGLPLDALSDVLRARHHAGGPHLNQSVNGGTQTEGMLLARIDPTIEQLRETIRDTIAHYVAALPPRDPTHPLLAHRDAHGKARRPRFAGSWSVRLRAGGHHSNHVHPAGWISSALYIDLPPPPSSAAPHAGWLALGQPPADLGLDLAPTTMVEPQRGKLVLFPSTMWHGTIPFDTGERLTVAFDIAYPVAS